MARSKTEASTRTCTCGCGRAVPVYFYGGINKGRGNIKYAPDCKRNETQYKEISSVSLAWAAGIIDGEGWIGISYPKVRGKRRHRLCISVANTNPRLPEMMQDLFGGSISREMKKAKPGRKQQWVWQVSAFKAASVLRAIRPFVIGKVEEVQVALEYAGTISGSGLRVTGQTREVLAKRDFCRIELMRLHREWRPSPRNKKVK